MSVQEHVYAALAEKNAEAAQSFTATTSALRHSHSEQELEAWMLRCQSLASSGWRAWELAVAYIAISESFSHQLSPQELSRCGDFASTISRNSTVPGLSYVRCVESLLPNLAPVQLESLEQGALAITTKHKYATKLTQLYFDAATALFQHPSTVQNEHWVELLTVAVECSQSDLQDLLEFSRTKPDCDWHFSRRLFAVSPVLTLKYLASMIDLEGSETAQQNVIHALLENSADYVDAAAWLDLLVIAKRDLSEQKLQNLLALSGSLPVPSLAVALAEAALSGRIDLGNLSLLRAWLNSASDMSALNRAASEAFIRLESARSIECYEALQGQVNLSDILRRLQIFAEAFCERRLRLGGTESGAPEPLKMAVSSNGHSLVLPARVSEYASTQENLCWYRMALCHQLAYYEFGSFDRVLEQPAFRFSQVFLEYDQPLLAYELFSVLEAVRVESQLERAYPGLGVELSWIKAVTRDRRVQSVETAGHQLFEYLLLASLGAEPGHALDPSCARYVPMLLSEISELQSPVATLDTSLASLTRAYPIFVGLETQRSKAKDNVRSPVTPWYLQRSRGKRKSNRGDEEFATTRNPVTWISYRGKIELDQALYFFALESLENTNINPAEEDGISFSGAGDPEDFDNSDVSAADEALGGARMLAETDVPMTMDALLDDAGAPNTEEEQGELLGDSVSHEGQRRFYYDEWDYLIGDYRRRWCTLFEIRDGAEDISYATEAISRYGSLGRQVKKQLNSIRPELLRKVSGVRDGEELDLQRAIDARISMRAGMTADENIYVQRQRKERDVAALFLLDMSASTDQAAADIAASVEGAIDQSEPQQSQPDYFHAPTSSPMSSQKDQQKIIDLEKQSVLLMAEALQALGDSYAICGFSGYGRDKVEFYICKDFQENYGPSSKGRIGGIQPRRSTRMGPAIRHATALLAATEAKTKALIIISDGYPQDFDYGADRNSKEYGIQDTTKALAEASSKSVQSFCLTVDPSGHDYLRDMCPDHQYMVMQDLQQLPRELSKIYRSLTA